MTDQCDGDGCENDAHSVVESDDDVAMDGRVYCRSHVEALLFGDDA
jgi:hypothetical protein